MSPCWLTPKYCGSGRPTSRPVAVEVGVGVVGGGGGEAGAGGRARALDVESRQRVRQEPGQGPDRAAGAADLPGRGPQHRGRE